MKRKLLLISIIVTINTNAFAEPNEPGASVDPSTSQNSDVIELVNTVFEQDVTLNGNYAVVNPSFFPGEPRASNDIEFAGNLTNTGTITLFTLNYAGNAIGGDSRLVFDNENTVLDGGGEIKFDNSGQGIPFIIGKDGTEKLTIKDQSIIATFGTGHLGNNTLSIVNEGKLIADDGLLIIDPNADGFVNQGTMDARNGGILLLTEGDFDLRQGSIGADNASTLVLQSVTADATGQSITGGEININSSSVAAKHLIADNRLLLSSSSVNVEEVSVNSGGVGGLSNTVFEQDVTLNGNYEILNPIFFPGEPRASNDIEFAGNLTNTGTITLFTLLNNGNAIGGDSRLVFDNENTVLDGGGEIKFDNSGQGIPFIIGKDGTEKLTIKDQSIIATFGTGHLGNNTLSIVNEGKLIADDGLLIIDPNADGFVNQGTMDARNGGILLLTEGDFDLRQGSIGADNASTLVLQSVTADATGQSITGGEININSSSVAAKHLIADNRLLLSSSSVNVEEVSVNSGGVGGLSNTVFEQDVTLNGNYEILNPIFFPGEPRASNDIEFAGNLTNTGTITLFTLLNNGNAIGGDSRLVFDNENTVLDGGGEIKFDNSGQGIPFIIGKDGTEKLTIKDQSIIATFGTGHLGNNTLSIVNEGKLIADDGLLIIDPNADGFVNQGTMDARNGGILLLTEGDFDLRQGSIGADNASTLVLQSVTADATGQSITGGEININSSSVAAKHLIADNRLLLSSSSVNVEEVSVNSGGVGGLSNTVFEQDVTLNGNYEILNPIFFPGEPRASNDIEFAGNLTNTGTITLFTLLNNGNAIGGDSRLVFDNENTVLDGGGEIKFDNSGQGIPFIIGKDGTEKLTIKDQSIIATFGTGHLGNNTLSIVNEGKLIADDGLLIIDPNADGFVNQGTMDARNGGILLLTEGDFDLRQGSIGADNASTLVLQSVTADATGQSITGGEININSSSVAAKHLIADNRLLLSSSSVNVEEVSVNSGGVGGLSNTVFEQDVTLNGNYEILNPIFFPGEPRASNDIEFAGNLTNTGTITLFTLLNNGNAIGGDSRLVFDNENTMLDGGGEIKFDNSGEGIPFIVGKDGTEKLTIKDQSIIATFGTGYLGNNTLSIVNEGKLIADDGLLIIDPNADGFVNQGTMDARNEGVISVTDDFSTSGLIIIDLGAALNGKLIDQNGGEIRVNGSLTANTLNIYDGSLSGSGVVNSNVTLFGGSISPGNSPDQLEINGDLTLAGESFLDFEFAGTSLGLFDQLLIGGDLYLSEGITLNLSLLDGFAFSEGDLFELFYITGNVFGNFSSFNFNVLGDYDYSLDFATRYENNVLLLDVFRSAVVDPNPVNAPSIFILIISLALYSVTRRNSKNRLKRI